MNEKELSNMPESKKSEDVFWSVGSVKMWVMVAVIFLGILFGSIGAYYAIQKKNGSSLSKQGKSNKEQKENRLPERKESEPEEDLMAESHKEKPQKAKVNKESDDQEEKSPQKEEISEAKAKEKKTAVKAKDDKEQKEKVTKKEVLKEKKPKENVPEEEAFEEEVPEEKVFEENLLEKELHEKKVSKKEALKKEVPEEEVYEEKMYEEKVPEEEGPEEEVSEKKMYEEKVPEEEGPEEKGPEEKGPEEKGPEEEGIKELAEAETSTDSKSVVVANHSFSFSNQEDVVCRFADLPNGDKYLFSVRCDHYANIVLSPDARSCVINNYSMEFYYHVLPKDGKGLETYELRVKNDRLESDDYIDSMALSSDGKIAIITANGHVFYLKKILAASEALALTMFAGLRRPNSSSIPASQQQASARSGESNEQTL